MKQLIELNRLALECREHFGEDSKSYVDVLNIIRNSHGFTLVSYPLSSRISGMCFRIEDESMIVLNSTQSVGRKRFSAAHELYHIVYQQDLKSIICSSDLNGKKEDEEINADVFASFFLAPYEALREFVAKVLRVPCVVSMDQLIQIEQYFGMSHLATLYRLKNEKLLNAEHADSLKEGVMKSAANLGYPLTLYQSSPQNEQFYTTGNYINLAELARSKGVITPGKYEEILIDAFRSDIVYGLDSQSEEAYD